MEIAQQRSRNVLIKIFPCDDTKLKKHTVYLSLNEAIKDNALMQTILFRKR